MMMLEQWTGNPEAAGSNPAQDQFFTMFISATVVLTALCDYRSGNP